jgi:hypothetical protein
MHCFPKANILTCVLVLSGVTVGFAQSLPEIARQQRLKQQARDTQATRKVVTDDDTPSRPESADDSKPSNTELSAESSPAAAKSAKSAAQWKTQILAQKNVVASLQDEVGQLSASVHFVEVNRYSNGVRYNQYQAKKQEEVTRLHKQLDSEKSKLAKMQEAARKAGFGDSVYKP